MPFERGILKIMHPSVLPWVHTYFENGTCGVLLLSTKFESIFWQFVLLRFISNLSSPSSIFHPVPVQNLLCPWLKSGFYWFRSVLGGYLNVLITTGSGYFKDPNQRIAGFYERTDDFLDRYLTLSRKNKLRYMVTVVPFSGLGVIN